MPADRERDAKRDQGHDRRRCADRIHREGVMVLDGKKTHEHGYDRHPGCHVSVVGA
jgi:hypothetical protein